MRNCLRRKDGLRKRKLRRPAEYANGRLLFLLTFLIFSRPPCGSRADLQTNEARSLILVIGAPGEPEFAEGFSNWSGLWKGAAAKGGLQISIIGEETNQPDDDKNRLLGLLTNEVAKPTGELWLVFIGHGSFDGKTAKLNLRGPDISAAELTEWLRH